MLAASRTWTVRRGQGEHVYRLLFVRHLDGEVFGDPLLDEAVQRWPAVWRGQVEPGVVPFARVEFSGHLYVADVSAICPRDELLQREAVGADAQRTRDGDRAVLWTSLAWPDPQAGCFDRRDNSIEWK